jgi:hypothetical protein
MGPNGTNDLIITNDNHEIIGSVPEATFGVSHVEADASLVCDYIGDAHALDDPELQEAGITGLYSVNIGFVLSNIAISPVSDESRVLKQLNFFNLI